MWKKGEVTAFLDGEEDSRKVSESQLITHRSTSGRTPVSAVRFAVRKMENEINGRMSSISTSIADSTDTRVNDLIEAGYGDTKLPNESRSLPSISTMRNFGNADTLIHGLNSSSDDAVFKDCSILSGSFSDKLFYDRNSEYLKCDGVPWEDLVKVQRTVVATSENLPGASLSLATTTTGACKFIKDENEPSLIMDTPCPHFDPSSEIPGLGICCETDRKQHLGLSVGESTGFTSTAAGPRQGLEGCPNFLIDLNQSEQLPALSQVRTDTRCGLTGKAVINFDAKTHTASQVTMYKNEVPRWPLQMSPTEPQYWRQATGVTEDPFTHRGYDGIQNQALSQRNTSPFSAFPG